MKKTSAQGAEDPILQWVTFRLDNETYGINVMQVQEVLRYTEIAPVPGAPSYVLGIINLRGNVVPVLDLAARFGLSLTAPGNRTCIVIIELALGDGLQRIGLVVDEVDEVLEIDPRQIMPAPAFGTAIRSDFIAGMAQQGQEFLIILNMLQVLSLDDIRHLSQAAKAH